MYFYIILYSIGVILFGILWGFTTREVIIKKGYLDEAKTWFWLGFFFHIIALIATVKKPDNHTSTDYLKEENRREQEILDNSGWKDYNTSFLDKKR